MYDIRLTVNILSESTFMISVDGKPAVPYSAPMYCDSYYSPIIGMDPTTLTNISNGVESIVVELMPEQTWQAPTLDQVINYNNY